MIFESNNHDYDSPDPARRGKLGDLIFDGAALAGIWAVMLTTSVNEPSKMIRVTEEYYLLDGQKIPATPNQSQSSPEGASVAGEYRSSVPVTAMEALEDVQRIILDKNVNVIAVPDFMEPRSANCATVPYDAEAEKIQAIDFSCEIFFEHSSNTNG